MKLTIQNLTYSINDTVIVSDVGLNIKKRGICRTDRSQWLREVYSLKEYIQGL